MEFIGWYVRNWLCVCVCQRMSTSTHGIEYDFSQTIPLSDSLRLSLRSCMVAGISFKLFQHIISNAKRMVFVLGISRISQQSSGSTTYTNIRFRWTFYWLPSAAQFAFTMSWWLWRKKTRCLCIVLCSSCTKALKVRGQLNHQASFLWKSTEHTERSAWMPFDAS